MAELKLSALPVITALTSADTLIVVRDAGAGVYTDHRVTAAALATLTRKVITVGTGGSTLTDAFFASDIAIILTDHQVYFRDDDFTQAGTTITGVTISFSTGQKLVAII